MDRRSKLLKLSSLAATLAVVAACEATSPAVEPEEGTRAENPYEENAYRFPRPARAVPADYLDVISSANGAPGWSSHAPMPQPREGACIAGVGDKIYVTHGYGPPTGDSNTTQIYDIASDTWTAGTPAAQIRSEGTGGAHGGKVYCIGGRTFGSENSNEIYDPTTDTWSTGAPMPTARSGFALVGAQGAHGKLFAIGGGLWPSRSAPRSGTPLSTNEVYNPASDTWSTAAPMPTARMDISAVEHGNRIYVVGGWSPACGGVCPQLEIYNIAKDTWTKGAPMPTPRSSMAVEVRGNTLFAIAGALQNGQLTNIVEAYNISKDTWSASIPKPTITAETFAWTHGDKVFVIGGGFFGLGFSPIPGSVNESLKPN